MTADILGFPGRPKPPPTVADALSLATDTANAGLDRLEASVSRAWDTENLSSLQIIAGEAIARVARRFGYAEAMALAEAYGRVGDPSPDGEAA